MTWYLLTKEDEGRAVVVQPIPPRGDDIRPDEERVLDGYEGYVIAATADSADILTDVDYLRREKRAAVDVLLNAEFMAGFPITEGTLAGERLQVRDGEDRTNWLTSKDMYRDAMDAGFGDVVDATFRTAANKTMTVTYAEGFSILQKMAMWGRSLLGRSWVVKDQINGLEGVDLVSFDVAAAWQPVATEPAPV